MKGNARKSPRLWKMSIWFYIDRNHPMHSYIRINSLENEGLVSKKKQSIGTGYTTTVFSYSPPTNERNYFTRAENVWSKLC